MCRQTCADTNPYATQVVQISMTQNEMKTKCTLFHFTQLWMKHFINLTGIKAASFLCVTTKKIIWIVSNINFSLVILSDTHIYKGHKTQCLRYLYDALIVDPVFQLFLHYKFFINYFSFKQLIIIKISFCFNSYYICCSVNYYNYSVTYIVTQIIGCITHQLPTFTPNMKHTSS